MRVNDGNVEHQTSILLIVDTKFWNANMKSMNSSRPLKRVGCISKIILLIYGGIISIDHFYIYNKEHRFI